MNDRWEFACPVCRTALQPEASGTLCCPQDEHTYRRIDGIWRFLRADRLRFFAQFIEEYETIRRAEQRGSEDNAHYRALPFLDPAQPRADEWHIRAASYAAFRQNVLRPLEHERGPGLRVLDLGAGNGWLSYRMARRGHHAAAVDLTTNTFDGLGAHVHYDVPFVPIQAEFDFLPLVANQADAAIFNAALHYTLDFETSLREALRVLRSEGMLVVLDTPVYHDATSGAQMVSEREQHFQKLVGFRSNVLQSENYLTYRRIHTLGERLNVRWQLLWPIAQWRWTLRRGRARLRGRREPAQFPMLVAQAP